MEECLLTGCLVSSPLVLVLIEMLELPDEAESLQGLVFPLDGALQPCRLLFSPYSLIA